MIKEVFPEFVTAITYFTGGTLFYLVYKICTALTARIRPVLRLLPDFAAGLTGGGLFLIITEFVAGATVKPYGIICYTAGFLLGSLVNIIPASSVQASSDPTSTPKKTFKSKRIKDTDSTPS